MHFLTQRGLKKGSENYNLLKSFQEIQVFYKIYKIFYTEYVTLMPMEMYFKGLSLI